MKKLFSFILLSAIISSTSAFATVLYFNDVPEHVWYTDATYNLSVKGIMGVDSNNYFRPNDNVNRAELAVTIDRLLTYIETNNITTLTTEQQAAKTTCNSLDGDPYLAFSELYGEQQIFCSFNTEGECTQGELNDGACFKQS